MNRLSACAVNFSKALCPTTSVRRNGNAGPSGVETTKPPETLAGLFEKFSPITLSETNELARMLKRVDCKYLLSLAQFKQYIASIQNQFSLLTINQVHQFAYKSCYYDDNFRCYYEHVQARRRRVKVRTREYVDCGSRFFEVKLKGLRGRTEKFRKDSEFLIRDRVTGGYQQMVAELYEDNCRKPFSFDLKPSLLVSYRRATLVALQGGERITVDYNLRFDCPGNPGVRAAVNNGFIIVETKTAKGRGISNQAFRDLNIRKAKRCSKYCIGLNLTNQVSRGNRFLPSIKRARRHLEPLRREHANAPVLA